MSNFDWGKFFENWKSEFGINIFAKDGIICPEKYENILFILKDVNNAKPGEEIDLRKSLIERSDEGKTWFDVASWSATLLDGILLKTVTHKTQHQFLKRVAVMNLKKEAGKPNANKKEIHCCACEHRENIIKEIKVCAPKVILACSRDVFEALVEKVFRLDDDYKFEKIQFTERMKGYGRYFDISEHLGISTPVYVIEYRHPNRCGMQGTREEHSRNMLEIRKKFLS